jgi:hypothetical protein
VFYDRVHVPKPTFCPTCRMLRRFQYRNERSLFRRIDAHDGKEIFSGFSSKSPVVTYENKYWYGDDWDQLASGMEYDFSRSFFEQFKELLSKAPIPARSVYNMVNSDYCNEMSESKNAYLCFNCDYVENSAYIRKMNHVKDILDSYEGTEDELCYENVMVDKSYRTFFSLDCDGCVDVWFSKGLRGCTDCFACVNLTKKSHYFFNEPYTKEEYDKKVSEYQLTSYSEVAKLIVQIREFWQTFPVKYNHTLRTLASTGERIFDAKNVRDSYSVRASENLRYCQDIQYRASNSYDYSVWGDGAENLYECMTCGMGSFNVKFSYNSWGEVRDLEYCIYLFGSNNCFGCVGLNKKQYCILNKQYTKEEYEELRAKIIEHMNEMPYVDARGNTYRYGEFFPFELSPYAYNESMAQDYFPLTEKEATANGFLWNEPDIREHQVTMKAGDLPDDSTSIDEGITKEVIECQSCNKAYRIIPMELQFYKRIGLPIPHMCHMCRFTERFKLVNPPMLWTRTCMCNQVDHEHSGTCLNKFETSYAPDRAEIVYCESCYQQEVN